jgi:hypothetical protein
MGLQLQESSCSNTQTKDFIMAKNPKTNTPAAEATENQEAGAQTNEAAPSAPAGGGKRITITLDEKHAPLVGLNAGDIVNRSDYIKARYFNNGQDAEEGVTGVTRGTIAAELTEMNGGVKVPYQIVFASTKGAPGEGGTHPAATATPKPSAAVAPAASE